MLCNEQYNDSIKGHVGNRLSDFIYGASMTVASKSQDSGTTRRHLLCRNNHTLYSNNSRLRVPITCVHLFTTSSPYFNTGGEASIGVEKVWVQVEKV